MKIKTLLFLIAAAASCSTLQAQGREEHFVGDVGGMLYASSSVVGGQDKRSAALPYAYGDWGRFYARVDTIGVRTLAYGHGHLELAARLGMEGLESRKTAWPALKERSAPLPLGLGTFQETPYGGVFAYWMRDPTSGGAFAELNWAAEVELGRVTFYPQLGAQYSGRALVNHLYGVSSAEAAATSLRPYQAGHAWVPMATLHATVPLTGPWSLQLNVRRSVLGKTITNSPLVDRANRDTGLMALSYRFE